MASNSSILVTVYDFNQVGNKFKKTYLQAIPLPAQFAVAVSPDPTGPMIYSKITYEQPRGMINEAYTAETVAQLAVKANQ